MRHLDKSSLMCLDTGARSLASVTANHTPPSVKAEHVLHVDHQLRFSV